MRKIAQIFVCFSESPNFKAKLIQVEKLYLFEGSKYLGLFWQQRTVLAGPTLTYFLAAINWLYIFMIYFLDLKRHKFRMKLIE